MPQTDDEGYLVDPETWSPDWAQATAGTMGIELVDEHWLVLRFMRDWYQEHQLAPDARHAMRHLGQHCGSDGRQRMFQLFPYGYVGQACKLAGMKRPRAWSTG